MKPTSPGRSKGGFLSAAKDRPKPLVEHLEDREVPAVIGGIVYQDLNFSGLFDTSESGIANTTVALKDSSNSVIATTTSDSTGHYQFTQRNINTNVPATSSYEAVFDLASTNATRSATLKQFDPSLGTLTSVDLIGEGSTTSKVIIENMDAQAATVKADVKASLRFNVAGTVLQASPETTKTANADAFDGQADLKGASAANLGNIQLTGAFNTTTLTDPNDLSAFVGTGTVPVAQDSSATVCTCGTGNLISMAATKTQGKVKVVYHYTPSNVIGPGQYTVVETQPNGFTDGFDTSDNITPLPNSDHTDSIAVTINSSTDTSDTNHFGETKSATITPPPPLIGDPDPLPSKFFGIFYF